MPGHKKSIQNDTLTFVNEELTLAEVIDIFRMYGPLKFVNKYLNRFFIQFESPKQARKAQFRLGRIYRVTYAHAKGYIRRRKNFRPQGQMIRFSNPGNLPRLGETASRNTISGMAMIEQYLNISGKQMSSASTRSEVARSNEILRENVRGHENRRERDRELENQREKSSGSQNGREMARGSENRREIAKSSKNQSQRGAKQNQRGEAAHPKLNSSQVRDPEHDDSDDSDDNIEGPEAQKPKAQKRPGEEGEAEEDEYEEEEEEDDEGQDENEEEDEQALARALGAGTRRRVRIRALDEARQELGHDMTHSVIVANIPARYTLDEVYDLVEEVKPLAFSEMDYSLKMRVKFCEVFVNDAADVDYLKQKLNDFVICGKQLMVMEPAEILDETRWNA